MLSECFPSPTGIMSGLVEVEKRYLRIKKKRLEEGATDSSDSDDVYSPRSPGATDSESSDGEGVLVSEELLTPVPMTDSEEDEEELYDEQGSLIEILKGTSVDVVSLLSNNGKTTHLVRSNGELVPIDDHLYEKYLLICCVDLPVDSESDFDYEFCRSLIDAYPELRQHSFEIVFVADKIQSDFHHHSLNVFNVFFSAFQCLAVPFHYYDTRQAICSFLNPKHRVDSFETILVDPTGHVLQHRMASNHFCSFGSEWYPFTDKCVERLMIRDDILRMRLDPFYQKRKTVSPEASAVVDLEQRSLFLFIDVFLCDSSLVLHRIDPAAGQSMDVLQLGKKLVGLYLCCDGEFMDRLNKVHKKCLAMKQELEIVLVGLPLTDDPMEFHESLLEALKLFNITSWFLFPFEPNRNVCRRLWRVFGGGCGSDKLVMFPPYNSGQPGELQARKLITHFGTNRYPFTATKIIQQWCNEIKSLNPISWFMDTRKRKRTRLILNDSESYVRKSALVGKKLLLYLDSLRLPDDGKFCYLLMEHYDEIKAIGCEVVFVPLDAQDLHLYEQNAVVDEMPWPIMPVQVALDASVTKQLCVQGRDYCPKRTLIAVGEDGKILSRKAHHKLKEQGVTESLFADTLYEEIAQYVIDLTAYS